MFTQRIKKVVCLLHVFQCLKLRNLTLAKILLCLCKEAKKTSLAREAGNALFRVFLRLSLPKKDTGQF